MPSDGGALAADLRAAVAGEVRFALADRVLYAADASIYRQVPVGIVVPRDEADVLAAVDVCRGHGVAILPRGAGTSQAGQAVNRAVVLDCSRHLDRVLAIDPDRRQARVQPGVVLDYLRARAERHRLTFGPDPSTHQVCTLGGMIGNNSCGVHSVTAGPTAANVDELRVVTYRGSRLRLHAGGVEADAGRSDEAAAIMARLRELGERTAPLVRERFPPIPRRISGYNLDELLPERGGNPARALVGTEGTCAIVLEATVRLVESPPSRVVVLLGFTDVAEAADAVPEVLAHGPIALEGIDDRLVAAVRRRGIALAAVAALPPGGGWLLAEFGGETMAAAHAGAGRCVAALGGRRALTVTDPELAQAFWSLRESANGATARAPGRGPAWPGWEDSAVPPARLGAYLRALRRLLDGHGYSGAFYGHFGDGCLHTLTDFELTSPAGVARFRRYVEAASDLVVGFGGSLSGEHGDGQARGELLVRMFGPELVDAFRDFKAIWDPDGRMNPGKVVDPARLDQDLRLRALRPVPERRPAVFRLVEDHGRLGLAARRCVGVGRCTRTGGGTMCPSYMATRDERHSTRGRAHLLFEMLETGAVAGGWRSPAVKEALDLCLGCKACRAECPAQVDMATYKAEFLFHHYRRRLRPRSAYALGLVDVWARMATPIPTLATLAVRGPLLGGLVKRAAGIAPERRPPAFARTTFRRWFRARPRAAAGGERVLLWVDTFNDHFRPKTARAATRVLEAMGCSVVIPSRPVCCGRPLYDQGMLTLARRRLRRVLAVLGDEVGAGTPVVGLEPSCLAVFRDELPGLVGDDERARRLAGQSHLLADFIAPRLDRLRVRPLGGRALVQPHCHHRAVFDLGPDRVVWRHAGLEAEVLEGGCCGMAGGFGYQRGEHHAVALRCGERVVLPAVRAADRETLVLADGFSCREQIEQATGRPTLHLAEALARALPPAPSSSGRLVGVADP